MVRLSDDRPAADFLGKPRPTVCRLWSDSRRCFISAQLESLLLLAEKVLFYRYLSSNKSLFSLFIRDLREERSSLRQFHKRFVPKGGTFRS